MITKKQYAKITKEDKRRYFWAAAKRYRKMGHLEHARTMERWAYKLNK